MSEERPFTVKNKQDLKDVQHLFMRLCKDYVASNADNPQQGPLDKKQLNLLRRNFNAFWQRFHTLVCVGGNPLLGFCLQEWLCIS